jgi:hypothetical protein
MQILCILCICILCSRHMRTRRTLTLWQMTVWAYRNQRVDRMAGRALNDGEAAADGERRQGRSGCGIATLIDRGALGCRVDGTGGSWGGSAQCHPDAELLHDAVTEIGRVAWLAALSIIQHARDGEAPERDDRRPRPGPTAPDRKIDRYEWALIDGVRVDVKIVSLGRVTSRVPVLDRKGRQTYRWRRGVKEPQFEASEPEEILWCPLTWEPGSDEANRTYDRWMGALETLATALIGVRFRDHEVIELTEAIAA